MQRAIFVSFILVLILISLSVPGCGGRQIVHDDKYETMKSANLKNCSNITPMYSSVSSEPGWIADENYGCLSWNSIPKPNETIKWSGACCDCYICGEGELLWFHGGKKVASTSGNWKQGKLHGKIVFDFGNIVYKNDYVNGDQVGDTVMEQGDFFKFVGVVKDGLPAGKGELTIERDSICTGEVFGHQDLSFEVDGKCNLNSDEKYKMSTEGKLKFSPKEELFKISGIIRISAEGQTYIFKGDFEFQGNAANGTGTLIVPGKISVTGGFKNGKPHGKMTIVKPDGQSIIAEFNEGVKVN